jgi:hypothetical protein
MNRNGSTQGRRLIAALKKRPHTYLEMQLLMVSTCPWKRVQECLGWKEMLVKSKDAKGRTTWRVLQSDPTSTPKRRRESA